MFSLPANRQIGSDQAIFLNKNNSLARNLFLFIFGFFLLLGASQLSIPFKPVPMTFQSITVILIGMTYGSRLGTSVVMSYLIAGGCGLPVFYDLTVGPEKFFGPTGGYLIGFIPGVFITGLLAERGWTRNFFWSFLTASIGTTVIFLFGVTMLTRFVGWHGALLFGLVPFVFSEFIKITVISFLVPRLQK